MQNIQNNPFRVIGVFADSSQRDIERQRARIKAFLNVGKEIKFDTDLDFIPLPQRDEITINNAFSNIQLNQNRLNHSLFWFVNAGIFDETAFNYLKEGDSEKALEIWRKPAMSEITERNFSAYNNLSTLKIALSTINGNIDKDRLTKGISYKLKLIESPLFEKFVQTVADETVKANSAEQAQLFINELIGFLNPLIDKNGFTINDLITLFSEVSEKSKLYVSQKLTDLPIQTIESKIETTKKSRQNDIAKANQIGMKLQNETKDSLVILSNLLGKSDVHFQMLSDKLAKEIMQCGIDYFSHYKNSSIDPSGDSMKLLKIAQGLAINSQTKERVKENIEGLQEWIDNKPIREKQKRIESDLDFITSKLERFQLLSDTVDNAKDLANSCKPKLQNMKFILGETDDLYLKLSSAIVNNSQGMLVTAVNEAQEGFGKYQEIGGEIGMLLSQYQLNNSNFKLNNLKFVTLPALRSIINEAYNLTTLLSSFDMEYQLRERFNQNRNSLSNIRTQINAAYSRSQTSSSSSSSDNSGCYIATMVYGDYEHPQVKVLRKFRDNRLSKTIAGKRFVNFYYKHSPAWVENLKNKQVVNKIIKFMLNQFIKIIR